MRVRKTALGEAVLADGEVVTGDPAATLRKRRDPLLVDRPED